MCAGEADQVISWMVPEEPRGLLGLCGGYLADLSETRKIKIDGVMLELELVP